MELPESVFKVLGRYQGKLTNSVVDPHNFGSLDPHPLQIIKSDLEPDPHPLADFKPECMEYEPILALFQGLSFFLKLRSGFWIRIRIK
jgi:hypothetical protein